MKLKAFSVVVVTLGMGFAGLAQAIECANGGDKLISSMSGWHALEGELGQLEKNIAALDKEVTAVVDLDKDIDNLDKELGELVKAIDDVALIAKPFSSFHKILKEAGTIADKIRKDAITPSRKVIDEVVAVGRLKTIKADLDKAKSIIHAANLDTNKVYSAFLKGGKDMIELCQTMDIIEDVAHHKINLKKPLNVGFNDMIKVIGASNSAAKKAAGPIAEVNKIISKDVLPVLAPLQKVHEVIEKAEKGLHGLAKVVHGIDKKLTKKIKVKVAGIKVIDKSVKDLAREMHHITDTIKKKLKIKKLVDEAKHLLNKELDKALKPIEKDISKSLKVLKKVKKVVKVDPNKIKGPAEKLAKISITKMIEQTTTKLVKP